MTTMIASMGRISAATACAPAAQPGSGRWALRVGARDRGPGLRDEVRGRLIEVKNAAQAALTAQLREMIEYAIREGYDFQLIVREGTKVSQPLLEALERGGFRAPLRWLFFRKL
jgi:hypothetical protein